MYVLQRINPSFSFFLLFLAFPFGVIIERVFHDQLHQDNLHIVHKTNFIKESQIQSHGQTVINIYCRRVPPLSEQPVL
jgi:hypothetical protein